MKLHFVTLCIMSALATGAAAQEPGPADEPPAADSSEAPAAETVADEADAVAAERDALEPGVPSAVLSADTRRTTRGNVVMTFRGEDAAGKPYTTRGAMEIRSVTICEGL